MTKIPEEVNMTQKDTITMIFLLHAIFNAKMFGEAEQHGIISRGQAMTLAQMTDSNARYWMEALFPNGADTVDEARLEEIKASMIAKNDKNATLQCGSVEDDVAGPQPTEAGVVDRFNPDAWENPQTVEEFEAVVRPYAEMMGRLTAKATVDGRLSFEDGLFFNRNMDLLFDRLVQRLFPTTGDDA